MNTLLKLGLPLAATVGLGLGAWQFLQQSGQGDNARRALDTAGSYIEKTFSGSNGTEAHFLSMGAIITSSANVSATLIVRGRKGREEVCRRVVHIRDYLVTILSDYPPDPVRPSDGPAGYGGDVVAEINGMLDTPAVERVRFDPYQLGAPGGEPSC